jgi:agmatinase
VIRGTPTIVGIPYDASSSFRRGAAGAPPAIRAALRSPAGNPWTEDLIDLSAPGTFGDAGDLDLPDSAASREVIERRVADVIASDRRPVVLGGDHSITYPVLRAVRPRCPRLSILHLDAHSDLYDVFEGDRFSHACPFARIMEEGLADQLVQVGVRALTGHQERQSVRFGVDIVDMRRWSAGDRPLIRHPVYVSFDLDALDPACAPGVAHREPGGLSVRDALGILQSLQLPIVGADIVEFNPDCDVAGMTATVAAKILKELVGAMVRTR